jgi:LysM repeat protein
MAQIAVEGGGGITTGAGTPASGVGGAPTWATLSPIVSGGLRKNRLYKPVKMALVGNITYNQIGQGGWQVVDRPKLAAATEWLDRSPWQLVFDMALDNEATSLQSSDAGTYTLHGTSVETDCLAVEAWMDKVPGSKYPEPPVLTISGPLPGIQRQWVLYAAEWDAALRHATAGYRYQQCGKITLYEYNPILPSQLKTRAYSPAAMAAATSVPASSLTSGTVQYLLYTVRTGDTMSRIAHLFHTTSADILALNGIRDPNSLVPGQVLSIPRPG